MYIRRDQMLRRCDTWKSTHFLKMFATFQSNLDPCELSVVSTDWKLEIFALRADKFWSEKTNLMRFKLAEVKLSFRTKFKSIHLFILKKFQVFWKISIPSCINLSLKILLVLGLECIKQIKITFFTFCIARICK